MQIFILDKNPTRAAQLLDDARVVKMCTETAQILCTVLSMDGHSTPMRPTHHNHPCVKWAKDPINMEWLFWHWLSILGEYRFRYSKTHQMERHIGFISVNTPITCQEPEAFCNAAKRTDLDIDFTHEPDVVTAYKKYLTKRWEISKVPIRYYRKVINTPTWEITKEIL